MVEVKAFVALASNFPTEAEAYAEQQTQTDYPVRDLPYRGLRKFPNVEGTLVHVFTDVEERVMQLIGWRKEDG